MKLKVNRIHRHGKIVVLPVLGETQIGEDGTFEVKDENVAKYLLEGSPKSFSLVEGKQAIKENKKEKIKKEEVKDSLSNLSLEELLMVAKESGLKGWQPLAKKPEALRKFLRKKIKELSK